MLLLFRFLLAMIVGHFRPRIGVLDWSVARFTALPHDCDLNFHLNAGRYISFMDVARMELLARSRVMAALLQKSWRPVMGGIVVRYRRSILPFRRFQVRSRLAAWDDKWFYLEHIVEKDGLLCAHAFARSLVRGPDGNIPPADVIALTGEVPPVPAMPEFLVRWLEAEESR